MNIKELLQLYSNNSLDGQYSFSKESYMNINGEEKYLQIKGDISKKNSSLTISENGKIIFNEKAEKPIEIANKLRNTLGHSSENVNIRASGLNNHQLYSKKTSNNTQKIEINRKQSNKPKITSFNN